MKNTHYANNSFGNHLPHLNASVSKKTAVGLLLIVALLAFEIFNFDTTQFALKSLLGEIRFLGIMWATILAIAFCSIDFAGLIRLFTPESNNNETKEVWYLTGAWLLGATMNAVMTWWAVSLTLLNHEFGNEVLSREQLLLYVPIFVAVLVWLTRILFIGAFSVAGDHIFDFNGTNDQTQTQPVRAKSIPQQQPKAVPPPTRSNAPTPVTAAPKTRTYQPAPKPQPLSAAPPQPEVFYEDLDTPVMAAPPQTQMPQQSPASRVRQRHPRSNVNHSPMNGVQTRSRRHN